MSILVFGKAAFLSSIHKCPNDRFCVEGEKGVMLHKTEHSKTSDSCQREETKQAQFFCKMYSFVLIRGLLSLCTLHSPPPAAVLPLNYSRETTHLSIFSLSIANGLCIPLCPTVKPINSIKLLKVIFSRSGRAVPE